jgi:hypothetical protein
VGLGFAIVGMIVGSLMTQSREHHTAPGLDAGRGG